MDEKHRLFSLQTYAAQKRRLREHMEEEGMIQRRREDPSVDERRRRIDLPHALNAEGTSASFSHDSAEDYVTTGFWPFGRRAAGNAAAAAGNAAGNAAAVVRNVAAAAGRAVMGPREPPYIAGAAAAQDLMSKNISQDMASADTVSNALAQFDKHFMPRELQGQWVNSFFVHAPFLHLAAASVAGYLNTDNSEDALPENNNNITFSREFLQSISLKEKFVMTPQGTFITWAAFIHLCKCEAVLALSDKSMLAILISMSYNPEDMDAVFDAWCEEVGRSKYMTNYDLDKQTTMINIMFGSVALMKRAITNFRSVFLIQGENKSLQQGDLAIFLNMDYQVWLRELWDEHVPTCRKAECQNNFEIFFRKVGTPASAAIRMVQVHAEAQMALHGTSNDVFEEAQRLDLFYANLVHGAAVRVPMSEVWTPNQVGAYLMHLGR